MNSEKVDSALDEIVRIRAVQDFLPCQGHDLHLPLEKSSEEELYQEIKESRAAWEDVLALEARVG